MESGSQVGDPQLSEKVSMSPPFSQGKTPCLDRVALKQHLTPLPTLPARPLRLFTAGTAWLTVSTF